jgi:hypothetical protein
MCIDEPGGFVIDGHRSVVHLTVDRSKLVVRLLLMPADQGSTIRFDPVEPVVLVRIVRSELKLDLYPGCPCRIVLILEELSWIYLTDNTVRTRLPRIGAASLYVSELAPEPVFDPVVKPLAL